MPCRVDLIRCSCCGGEHYFANECLMDPSKAGEGLPGYKPVTVEPKVSKKKKAFNVEGALCDVLTLLEDKKLLGVAEVPQDILDWWNAHQSREQEKIKKEALAKLTKKEKRALGLK
jgi:hypothetical protein